MSRRNRKLKLTARLAVNYLKFNKVPLGSVTGLVQLIAGAVDGLEEPAASHAPPLRLKPAVPRNQSVFPDRLICLDDGKPVKMLKRHLSKLGMTPNEYRAKWGLPSNYPMVAPDYSDRRSALALKSGLGRTPIQPK